MENKNVMGELIYLNYDNLDPEEELADIENFEEAKVYLEPRNKMCLFILGMLFANGVNIKILNEEELDVPDVVLTDGSINLNKVSKSFSIMSYVWSRIGDKGFPSPDFSNVKIGTDKLIENVKRMGLRVEKINSEPVDKKIFLICPVRNATPEQKKWMEDFVVEKYKEGYTIHAPHLHTVQTDLFGGYAICKQNAEALASSEEVNIYYDKSSTGTAFDLGVAYALHKPLILLNEEDIVFDENNVMDNIIESWPFNEKVKTKELCK